MPEPILDVSGGLEELAGLLVADEDVTTTLERVVAVASRCLSGAMEIGVLLADRGGVRMAACSSPGLEELIAADAGNDAGDGPAIEALKSGEQVVIHDTTADDRWPRFSGAAAQQGTRSVLVLPLMVRGDGAGVLMFHSPEAGAFSDEVHASLVPFAAQAAVALHNAATYDRCRVLVDQLTEALDSRVVIEQAKGVLMEREQVDAGRAFELLRELSQRTNTRVQQVAERVVESARGG